MLKRTITVRLAQFCEEIEDRTIFYAVNKTKTS